MIPTHPLHTTPTPHQWRAPPSSSTITANNAPRTQPSPIPFSPHNSASSSASSSLTTTEHPPPPAESPPIRLRNLQHVVELAHATPRRRFEERRKFEISSMPVPDVIEMVSGLLTKITTTNDRTRTDPGVGAPNSVLAFHGKNVPSITINSYLSRIHKYCPTTYEVFLSLLVYFDRMTERVNRYPYANGSVSRSDSPGPGVPEPQQAGGGHVFVVDSFNIHRLVIAGVTCASKFFSDVFYTNSRYAKVGGLPLTELNHLELQFLILNDFRLSVPVEELEAYGTMLVQFYARETLAAAEREPPSLQRAGTV